VYPLRIFVDDSHNTADSLFTAIQANKAGTYKYGVKVEARNQ
jgi:hypothetical protein